MGYEIYIRDSNFNRVGQITDFAKLELIPRFNSVGSFALDLPTDCAAARELIKDKSGIIVKKDGITIFSGMVTSPKRTFSTSGDMMTITGKDDMDFLNSRLAYPVSSGNFSLSDYDVRTGEAETIMKQYVDYNAGPNASPERAILTIEEDTGIGSVVTSRARFDKLIDLLSSIALKGGGLGFRVVQVENNLEFQVYQPSDKTKSAYFSPILGNLSSFDYSKESPEGNFVLVGGGGEGTARIIKQKSDNTSIVKYGRIESFVDQRNTSDLAELEQSLDEELTNKAGKSSFNFTPIDTPQLSFSKDYGLGDKVSIVITQPNEKIDIETLYYFISFYQTDMQQTENVRSIQEKLEVIQDIVREVKITISPSGESITPVVGTEESLSKETPKIFDQMKKLNRRISNLERR